MKTETPKESKHRREPAVNKRHTDKLLMYEALGQLNHGFAEVIDALERLERLRGLQRSQRRSLRGCRVSAEETRSWANLEVIDLVRAIEEKDWSHFGRLRSELEATRETL
jgi:hypothetical protein